MKNNSPSSTASLSSPPLPQRRQSFLRGRTRPTQPQPSSTMPMPSPSSAPFKRKDDNGSSSPMASLHREKAKPSQKEDVTHGVLLLCKPEGLSSHGLVHEVRKLTGLSRVGHCGILDPMASGLMILLLGEATKMSSYLLNQDKLYEGTLLWGVTTDTLDCTGNILEKKTDFSIDSNHLKREVQRLQGEHLLPVPLFSAMKIKGKQLYKYARQNQKIEPPKKKMSFHRIELLEENASSCRLRVLCSKGSYIRALVAFLGEKMGPGATLSQLCRLQSQPYSLNEALTLEELRAYIEQAEKSSFPLPLGPLEERGAFIPLAKVLSEAHTLYLEGRDRFLMIHGQLSYSFKSRLNVFRQNHVRGRGHGSKEENPSPFRVKVLCTLSNKLLALLEWEEEKEFQIKRVFKY